MGWDGMGWDGMGGSMDGWMDGWMDHHASACHLFKGSFADAGHVYVHMRNGSIGEQVGGAYRFSRAWWAWARRGWQLVAERR